MRASMTPISLAIHESWWITEMIYIRYVCFYSFVTVSEGACVCEETHYLSPHSFDKCFFFKFHLTYLLFFLWFISALLCLALLYLSNSQAVLTTVVKAVNWELIVPNLILLALCPTVIFLWSHSLPHLLFFTFSLCAPPTPPFIFPQGMNFLAGMLLLFLEPEDSFWGLIAVTEKYFSSNYFDQNLIGAQVSLFF